jgi:flagellar hook-length control protein FliK
MNQLVSFFAPTALPNAAGAAVRAQNGAQGGDFAGILAQVQNTLAGNTGQIDPATQQLLDQFPPGLLQAAANLSTDQIAKQLESLTRTPTGENTPQLKALLALLNGSVATAQPTVDTPTAPEANADTSLAAMLAALQLQTQSTTAEPAQPTSQATATTQNAPATPAAFAAAGIELGLRGSVAATEQTPAPQTAQPEAPANAKAAENAATALLAPTATARPKNEAQQQLAQAQPGKTSDNAKQKNQAATAATNKLQAPNAAAPEEAAAAPGSNSTTAQPNTASQTTASAATPVLPNDGGAAQSTPSNQTATPTVAATAAAPALSNLIDAQQMSVTISTTPQAAVPLEALAVQIARKFEAGISQFEIRLHPAELGQLDISLSVADDGHIQAVLRAERPETLDLLQRDARSLEQQLRQAGLEVGSNALSFSLSGGNGQQRHAPFAGWPAFAEAQDAAAKQDVAKAYIAVRNPDGIDIRV